MKVGFSLHEGHLSRETLHGISYSLGISSVLLHVYVNMSACQRHTLSYVAKAHILESCTPAPLILALL